MNDTTTTEPATLDTTIDRYIETWNEPDADRRTAICREIWADEGRYVDPLVDASGPVAISESLGALQAQFPGHTVARSTGIDSHHDRARFGWTITAPDGSVPFAGIDLVVVAPDGRLQSITGFIGDVEAAA